MSDRAPGRTAAHAWSLAPSRRFHLRAFFSRTGGAGLLLAAAAVLSACGSGGDGGKQNKPADTVAPEIKDVQGTLGDPSPGSLDLSSSDAQRVITAPTPLTLRISAKDDVTSTDKLSVQALDGSDQPLADQTATFHNGLWEIATTAKVGLSIHVAVSDEAKNQTVWPHAAVFPTKDEAVVRKWTLLVYDSNANVVSRPNMTVTTDTWCQDDDAAGNGPSGGDWSVLGDGRLQLDTRHHMACSSATPGTVESTRTSEFYVDATYFSDQLYAGGGSSTPGDIVGTWTYSVDIKSGGQTQTITPKLDLTSGLTFTQDTEDGHTLQGTYEIRHNTDYSNDFGELLVLTVDTMDGGSVTPVTSVHYFTVRDGKLLVDPFVEVP